MYVTRFSFSHKLAVINEVKRTCNVRQQLYWMFQPFTFYLYQKLYMAYIKRLISFHNATSLKHKAINRKTICMHYIYMKIKVGAKIVKLKMNVVLHLG